MKSEYYCAQCGKMFITRAPADYRYRLRDWRKTAESRGKSLFFCSAGCMSEFEKQNHRRKYNTGFKV